MASSGIIALAFAALAACAHGAAVSSGSTLNPMVWPLPQLGAPLIQDPQIIGGSQASTAQYPHQASMQVSMLWIVEQHICGATILNERWLLTAAHCVKGVPWYTSAFILAGKTNLGKDEAGQQRRAIKKMYVHSSYQSKKNGGVGPFDIGLIQLAKPLEFSNSVKPAKLPVKGAIPTGSAILTGWGSISKTQQVIVPEILQTVTLPVIDFATCNKWIQEQADAAGEANPLAESNVCVGYLDKAGQGACSGDSGGPLIQYDSNGDAVVIGATSWGYFPCQQSASPSVYTRVSAYNDWINERISK